MTTKAMKEQIHVYFEALKVFIKSHPDKVVYEDSRWKGCYRNFSALWDNDVTMYIKYGHQAPSGMIYKDKHSIQFFTCDKKYWDEPLVYTPISLQRMIEFELGICS